MGPSHYADLRAASVTNADVFRTPLGDVPISAKARTLARLRPFALEPPCLVQRPDWWRQSSRAAPADDTADTWEHSVEVEVPFLQRTLKNFPAGAGRLRRNRRRRRPPRALLQILDDRTLIIASSDLSHYYSYANAQELDRRIRRGHLPPRPRRDRRRRTPAARIPIRTLMYVAKQRGWKARLLDCRNSGDTSGDKSRVVGYAAIAFYAPAPRGSARRRQFTAADRRYLLDLARKTVQTPPRPASCPRCPPTDSPRSSPKPKAAS